MTLQMRPALVPTSTGPAASPAGRASTARWVLSAGTSPPVTLALAIGERLRTSVLGAARTVLGDAPPVLAGRDPDGRPAHGHRHPFYLAEDADGDGVIDHVVMHAPDGLAPAWRPALAQVQPAAGGEGGLLAPFRITLDWIGGAEAAAPGVLLGASRVWRSATPYVPDWHLKAKFGVAAALARELRLRGLPEPESVEPVPALDAAGQAVAAAAFLTRRISRSEVERPAAHSRHPGSFWRLRFPEPVAGPLAFGFACHLGLGVFRREEAGDAAEADRPCPAPPVTADRR